MGILKAAMGRRGMAVVRRRGGRFDFVMGILMAVSGRAMVAVVLEGKGGGWMIEGWNNCCCGVDDRDKMETDSSFRPGFRSSKGSVSKGSSCLLHQNEFGSDHRFSDTRLTVRSYLLEYL